MRYSPISGWEQFTSVVLWIALFMGVTPFFHSFLMRLKRIPGDVSWVLSKLLGFYFFAWLVSAPASLGIYTLSNSWIRVGYFLFVVLGAVLCLRGKTRDFFKDALRGESVFLLGFTVFTFLWALHPELKTGEKSMNFSFLNFFIRNDSFPPEDPWAAGIRTHYYYFGSFAFALWHRIGGIPSVVGYGLSIAAGAAFLGSIAFAGFRHAGFSFKKSAAFSLFILIAGNVEVLYLYFSDEMRLGYELFWESSRIFSNGRFSEFPLWTYLFGDLHAHNMALPFGILGAFLFSELLESRGERSWILPIAFGLIAGLLPISNTWDVFLLAAFVVSVLLLKPIETLKLFPQLVVALGVTLVVVLPYYGTLMGGRPAQFSQVTEEWVTLEQSFRFFGFPLVLIFLNTLARVSAPHLKFMDLKGWVLVSLAALWPWAFTFIVRTWLGNQAPWPVDALLVVSVLNITVALLKPVSAAFFERAILQTAALLILFVDLASVFDRTITLFKCYFQVSALLWVGALLGWEPLVQRARTFVTSMNVLRRLTLGASLLAGVLLTISILNANKSPQIKPSLDSMGYLTIEEPRIARLLGWIQENIEGHPRILDAWGSGEMGRVTVNIGFPDFAHWEAHTILRGVPHRDLIERRDLIREFYTTNDAERAFSILKSNAIEYFMVTVIERKIYAAEKPNFDKFGAHPELFRLLHNEEGEAIYAVGSK